MSDYPFHSQLSGIKIFSNKCKPADFHLQSLQKSGAASAFFAKFPREIKEFDVFG
jgi:hypothetical protein